eukprot:914375-Amphidinium_carterae.1
MFKCYDGSARAPTHLLIGKANNFALHRASSMYAMLLLATHTLALIIYSLNNNCTTQWART